EVVGSIAETFIKERAIVEETSRDREGAGQIVPSKNRSLTVAARRGKSDVDDAVLFLARFRAGAVASFEATRLATGNQNKNGLEIHGEKGSIRCNLEDQN